MVSTARCTSRGSARATVMGSGLMATGAGADFWDWASDFAAAGKGQEEDGGQPCPSSPASHRPRVYSMAEAGSEGPRPVLRACRKMAACRSSARR